VNAARLPLVVGCLWFFCGPASIAAQPPPQSAKLQRLFGSVVDPAATEVMLAGTLANRAISPATFPAEGTPARPPSVFYAFTAPQPRAELILAATNARSVFTVTVYAIDGTPLVSTYAAASEQRLVLPGVAAGTIEVTLEARPQDDAGGFTLSWSATPQEIEAGYAYRAALREDVYQDLLDFAACDTADPRSDCGTTCDDTCEARAYAVIYQYLGGADSPTRTPVVTFVGAAGVNRILLAQKRQDGYTPRHYRSLGQERTFWTMYLEDALAPFDTSVDVQFRTRATIADYEEFDPVGVGGRMMSESNLAFRVLRVGLREFRVRQPPVDIEIAFSRQGPGYGLRQWQRAYRVYAWKPVVFSGGIFVPGTEVTVENFEVAERPPSGSDALPFDSILLNHKARRPLFVVGSVLFPWRRANADNATSGWSLWWHAFPELVGGVALPTAGHKMPVVWYSGLSWPIAWNRLSATVGVVSAKQYKLKRPYDVGHRVPLGTDVATLTYRDWVHTVTVGVTVDLVRSR